MDSCQILKLGLHSTCPPLSTSSFSLYLAPALSVPTRLSRMRSTFPLSLLLLSVPFASTSSLDRSRTAFLQDVLSSSTKSADQQYCKVHHPSLSLFLPLPLCSNTSFVKADLNRKRHIYCIM